MRPNRFPTLPALRSAALAQPLHLLPSPRLPPAENHSRRQQPTREGTHQHRPFVGSSISFPASHWRRAASHIPLGPPTIVVVEGAVVRVDAGAHDAFVVISAYSPGDNSVWNRTSARVRPVKSPRISPWASQPSTPTQSRTPRSSTPA
ncbi:hypothetical protein LshimejAT787_3800070 [Lyophyllum shimeji]|uniref:Uncharacterized protein n=1 Tax=Lyophyllum shimeji TaxID=47721 RepID=A0A9P3Q2I9_LYOSH|nr:hypothetical protein LshimejAT787_3800070 [Lyophyllum shimeji]